MAVAELFPGVRPVSSRLSGAQEASSRAVALAGQAAASGSFGVGGLIADRSGLVYAEAVNAVIENGRVRDPTAHVERQLIDWYFEARHGGLTIAPDELVIVSSLDPCAMCAGAILLSGFNCIVVAEDPASGVHQDCRPMRMPEQLRRRAQSRMAFFSVAGRRPPYGAKLGGIFAGDISAATLDNASAAFSSSLEQVREHIGGGDGPSELGNLSNLDFSSMQPELPEGTWIFPDSRWPKRNAARKLRLTSDSRDVSVIVDRHGRVMLGADSAEDRAPTRSSVLQLIRSYVRLRQLARERLNIDLPHQRNCTIVKRRVPELPEKALLELGAVGSFLEQPRPFKTPPALAFLEWNPESLKIQSYLATLAPLYTDVIGLSVGPASELLKSSAALPRGRVE